jgi:hypothetical protein
MKNKWDNTKSYIGSQTSDFGPNTSDNISSKAINIKYLLKNPDIENCASEPVRIDPGNDHSKEFVRAIGEIVKKNKLLKNYVRRISSCGYGPRGEIEISYNQTLNAYLTTVNDRELNPGSSRSGYAAKIEFYTKEKWKVIVLTKIIISQIKNISCYKVKISAE